VGNSGIFLEVRHGQASASSATGCTHAGARAGWARGPMWRSSPATSPTSAAVPELEGGDTVPAAASYEAVAADERVQILVVSSDPCDKADMVQLARPPQEPVLHNKPSPTIPTTPGASCRPVAREWHQARATTIPMVRGIPGLREAK